MYVDDFKLAGKAENLEAGWKAITDAGVRLDPPTKFDHYLGCGQALTSLTVSEAEARLNNISCNIPSNNTTPEKIRAIRYDMKGFFNQVVEKYCELSGVDRDILKKASTPSIDDRQIKPEEFETRGAWQARLRRY